MTDTQRYTGRAGARRITRGLIQASALNEQFQGLNKEDPHPQAIKNCVNKAAPALGLSQTAVAIYNRLFDCTSPKDWLPGSLPIVWPSNERIMQDLGIRSINTLRAGLAQLADAALIEYKDSPTKKRHGRRFPNGHIDLANSFGIILSSAAVLYSSLLERAKAWRAEQIRIKGIKRGFTAARRRAEELLTLIEGEGLSYRNMEDLVSSCFALLGHFHGRRPSLDVQERLADEINTVCDDIQALFHDFDREREENQINEMDATPPNNWDPIRTIPSPSSHSCNSLREVCSDDSTPTLSTQNEGRGDSYKQILSALPWKLRKRVREDFGYYELLDILCEYAAENGITERRIKTLPSEVGIETACGIVTVIYAKRGRIKRPDRYLEAMVDQYRKSELNIARSLFGIIALNNSGAYPESHSLFG